MGRRIKAANSGRAGGRPQATRESAADLALFPHALRDPLATSYLPLREGHLVPRLVFGVLEDAFVDKALWFL